MQPFKKTFRLLSSAQRRRGALLILLMLIGALLETLGVGLVIPSLALMTQSDLAARHPRFEPILAALGHPSREHLVLIGMLAFVALSAVKTVFLGLVTWWQSQFVSDLQAGLSQRLFSGYLRLPYAFHLRRNSSELIYNTTALSTATATVAQQTLVLLTELMVLTGISLLLLSVEPFGAIVVVSTIGVAGWGFNQLMRTRILRWGKAYKYHEARRYKHLQEGLGGVKDVKLTGREHDFLAQYRFDTLSATHALERQVTLQALPRLWLELLAIAGLAALVLVMVENGRPLDALLPTLGLFAAAAFRIMPSVNRLLGAVQSVRFNLPVIETVHAEISMLPDEVPPVAAAPVAFHHTLALDHVTFRYVGAPVDALSDVSLVIERGSSVGFVGGSGAGKSTLVDVILGLLTPESGAVLVDGVDIQASLRRWQDQIGYVPQFIFLTDDTLRRNVAFGLADEQIDEAAVQRAITAAQLDEFVASQPEGLNTVVGERGVRISGGQRQRIGIARALYHDPAVLVLDEATSSLDNATERDVMEAVRALARDKTVLIVAHRLTTVAHCDRLYRLEGGVVVEHGAAPQMLVNLR